jgi:hypothetical protein
LRDNNNSGNTSGTTSANTSGTTSGNTSANSSTSENKETGQKRFFEIKRRIREDGQFFVVPLKDSSCTNYIRMCKACELIEKGYHGKSLHYQMHLNQTHLNQTHLNQRRGDQTHLNQRHAIDYSPNQTQDCSPNQMQIACSPNQMQIGHLRVFGKLAKFECEPMPNPLRIFERSMQFSSQALEKFQNFNGMCRPNHCNFPKPGCDLPPTKPLQIFEIAVQFSIQSLANFQNPNGIYYPNHRVLAKF